MLKAELRYAAMLLGQTFVVLLLPVLWVAKKLLGTSKWFGRVSVWTGAPIITVAKNCRAERSLGFNSISVVRNSYYITDEFDWVLSRVARQNRALTIALSYLSFLLICLFTEQVHAYADGGILPPLKRRQFNPLELLAYRFFGVRLMIWAYGADVRTRQITRSLGEPNCCTDCTQVEKACICDVTLAKENYRRVTAAATGVFSMGDMIEYTPGSRNDLFYWPIDLSANQERFLPSYPSPSTEKPLRLVHAPNHREFKGTRYLEQAVESLRREGVTIELILIEGIPNDQAIEIYRSADVIFDQCLIGFHGYFALEAMALGKPVLCFIRKPREYLLRSEECPIINVHIDTLEHDLRQLVERRDELEAIGKRGRQYVEKYYSLSAFAGRLQNAYRDLGIVR